MKIEKISDNQIRCTLTGEDLSSRDIRLSELAYGSDKARKLFQDMMEEAHYEVGFDSGNSPLMIEAIPTSSDSVMLVITKVEDPDELDSRFSKFTQDSEEDLFPFGTRKEGGDDILDLFNKIYDQRQKAEDSDSKKEDAPKGRASGRPAPASSGKQPDSLVESFRFKSLDDIIAAARSLDHNFSGRNALYKVAGADYPYQLILHQSGAPLQLFNQVCNVLSEYGRSETFTLAQEAYLKEHGDALVKSSALQKLAGI